MKIEVERICPNHLDPDFEFIQAIVVFSKDDIEEGHAEVDIKIKKDPTMTLPQIIDAAIQKARAFLSEILCECDSEGRKRS
jgi:hypothetical protein